MVREAGNPANCIDEVGICSDLRNRMLADRTRWHSIGLRERVRGVNSAAAFCRAAGTAAHRASRSSELHGGSSGGVEPY